jgi:tripartite-type tricarboxylate transporter receptor subunit TctC
MLRLFVFLATILLLAVSPASASCRTMTIYHPYGPGSTSASAMRLLVERMKEKLQVSIVLEYRPGALGVPSATALTHAKPDGCTLGVLAGIHTASPWLMESKAYDPRVFVPIGLVATFPNLIVTADPRMRTLRDFLRIAREHPKQVTVGTMSRGSPDFLTGLFLLDAGVPIHLAPYHPRSEATQMPVDVLNGTLHVGIQNYFVFAGVLSDGRARALAVTTKERLGKLPDVPTVFEAGLPDFTETKSWLGLFGPPGISQPEVLRLHTTVHALLQDAALHRSFHELGIQPASMTPEALGRMVEAEYQQQGEAIRRTSKSAP